MMSDVMATEFSRETLSALDEVARELKCSRAEVVRRAVDVYLREYADQAIALARLNDPTDAMLTTAEMWRELGWAGDEQPGVSFGDRS